MSDAVIRKAETADAETLAALITVLGYPLSPAAAARRMVLVERSGNRIFVAETEGRVVGCLTTSMMQALHRPAKVGRISLMVVEQRLRGGGIGSALLAAAEKFLSEEGCDMIEVTSRFDRTRAHGFYERLGYDKTSVRLARQLAE